MEGIHHVSTFKTVTKFLLEVAVKEILHGDQEELTQWKGRAGEFKKTLLDEMKKYARQQYPFNERFDSNEATITWWKKLEGSENAQVLPVSVINLKILSMLMLNQILAKKVFSVRVNSMPEERTVSSFTWITGPLRSHLTVAQMARRTQIKQHYSTETKVLNLNPDERQLINMNLGS